MSKKGKPDSPPGQEGKPEKPGKPEPEPIPPEPEEPPVEPPVTEPPSDGSVERPREYMDTVYVEPGGRVIEAGGDLQGALGEAQGGDQVVLAAGDAVRVGEDWVREKNMKGKVATTNVVDGICECGHYESEHIPACLHLVMGCKCEGYKEKDSGGSAAGVSGEDV